VRIGLSPAGRTLIDEAVPAITNFETALVTAAIPSPRLRSHVEDGLRRILVAQEAI